MSLSPEPTVQPNEGMAATPASLSSQPVSTKRQHTAGSAAMLLMLSSLGSGMLALARI